jgi:hypothetical protein
MYSKKRYNEVYIQNENNNNYDQQINPSIQVEDNNQESDLLVINNDEDPYTNYRYYQKEMFLNDGSSQAIPNNLKNQIFANVRVEPYKRRHRAQISNYIYHTERPFSTKNNSKTEKNSDSKTKYSIKNPTKEKSKNKFNNNTQNSYKINQNKINRNLRIINNGVSNEVNNGVNITDINGNYYDNEEKIDIVNNTNYNFRPANININTDYSDTSNLDINQKIHKGGNIDLHPKKQYNKNFYSLKNNQIPRESHFSYIYDYSQEKNFDYATPKYRHDTYFIKPRVKRRNEADFITFNNNTPQKYNDKLKKKIEKSRLKFESIREIEKKIKNYFNLNGLKLENRELYDQSATMIQSTFRGYYLRAQLFDQVNTYINMKCLLDVLEKIFYPRKMMYWENFLKGILNFLSYLNNLNKELSGKKLSKKIPNSYRRKTTGGKMRKDKNELLMPQSCVSIDLSNKNNYRSNDGSIDDNMNMNEEKEKKYLEEKYNKLLLENEELKKSNNNLKNMLKNANNFMNNNNIVKNTQESVELKFDDDNNLTLVNNKGKDEKIKRNKLKFLVFYQILKNKGILHKYFLKFYYNAMLMKNNGKVPMIYTKNIIRNSQNNTNEISFREKKNEKIYKKRIKKLKNVILKNDLRIRNVLYNKFIVFYFKGLVNQIQNNNVNKFDNDNDMEENNKKEQGDLDIEEKDECIDEQKQKEKDKSNI